MKKFLVTSWILTGLLYLYYYTSYSSMLPATVASHWDLAGNVNAVMPKQSLEFILNGAIFISQFLTFITYWFIDRFPPAFINLSNKDYWFSSPELKAVAFEKLRIILSMTGCFLNVLNLLVLHLIFQENGIDLALKLPMSEFLVVVGLMTAGLLGSSFWMTRKP